MVELLHKSLYSMFWRHGGASAEVICGMYSGEVMTTTKSKIEVSAMDIAAKRAAFEAAQIQAKVCLDGCPSCLQVTATAPRKFLVGRITAQAISVRSKCERIPANLVRPPKDVPTFESCPIWKRAEIAQLRRYLGDQE